MITVHWIWILLGAVFFVLLGAAAVESDKRTEIRELDKRLKDVL